ncbi:hypothetical protein ACFX14_005095 [Malus domestica]
MLDYALQQAVTKTCSCKDEEDGTACCSFRKGHTSSPSQVKPVELQPKEAPEVDCQPFCSNFKSVTSNPAIFQKAISTFSPSHGRHERTKRVRAPEQEAKNSRVRIQDHSSARSRTFHRTQTSCASGGNSYGTGTTAVMMKMNTMASPDCSSTLVSTAGCGFWLFGFGY